MKLFESNDRSVIRICVDERPGSGFSGRIAAPYLPDDLHFSDAGEMLLIIEAYLDATGAVQAYQRGRTFGKKRAVETVETPREGTSSARGKLGTCVLRVTTRQNATWQGYADMGEGGEFFSSALELVYLLDEGIQG